MNHIAPILFILCLVVSGCNQPLPVEKEEESINALLNTLNKSAAEANYNAYFDCFSKQSHFMGTDATEKWDKPSFMLWAKPFFDRGKAWNFKTVRRSIYMNPELPIAWFDEILSTQMKICRGSGVVAKEKDGWKIKQYVLSMTIPNAKTDSVVLLKSAIESALLDSFMKHK